MYLATNHCYSCLGKKKKRHCSKQDSNQTKKIPTAKKAVGKGGSPVRIAYS